MNAHPPETWLFDLGNTRLKAARLDRGSVVDVFALAWQQGGFAALLAERLCAWSSPSRVLVASVAGETQTAALRAALPAGAAVEWLRSPREACGVRNRYARPERLGIDRFMSLLALREAAGAGVIVGCGTALTLDALAPDGAHADGLIALSPARMLAALHAGTAIADANPDAFADAGTDDTARALRAGCAAAAGALVEWFHARRPAGTPLYLHGGWAPELAAWLARDGHPAQILEHAVLRGLAAWAARSP